VRLLKADGLHVTGGIKAVEEAISALKPDLIVGVGDSRSRHDAMQKGEAGIDYMMFGPLYGPLTEDAREMAIWWAETMDIPAVLSNPEAALEAYDALGCDFIALTLPALEAGA
jgi:thiamine-phosphate pyrophosphorylase